MKPYEKSQSDINREESDLKNNAVMRWLLNQDAFRFNPGDILIKKTKRYSWDPQSHTQSYTWETEVITKATGAPKKYVFCFENKLGIGYLKQLKANGDGYVGQLICVANFDPDNTRFELDPDFADHQLIGDGDYEYQKTYLEKRAFREEAMAKNRQIMIKTSNKKGLKDWFTSLKPGDEFWAADSFDELEKCRYRVKSIDKATAKPRQYIDPQVGSSYYSSGENYKKNHANRAFLKEDEWMTIEVEVISCSYQRPGSVKSYTIGDFSWKKVTMQQPFPMKDPLCAPQK